MIIRYQSIKRISRIIGFTIVLAHLFITAGSQDLYDRQHSERYAEYLYSGHQFSLAAEEYERLVYFDRENDDYKLRLIKSYRLSGDFNKGINRIYSLYGDSVYNMPAKLTREFISLQLITSSLESADKFIREARSVTESDRITLQGLNTMLKGDYPEAEIILNNGINRQLNIPASVLTLSAKAAETRMKSPFLAATFSALVPGTGKFYTKNWTDGLMSILFIAGNSWQAYRGFSEKGIKSGYGWVFTGLSASFYIGNIFGSAKAAKRYNLNKRSEIGNQVYEILRSDSF
jgi:hypothetical protein